MQIKVEVNEKCFKNRHKIKINNIKDIQIPMLLFENVNKNWVTPRETQLRKREQWFVI